MRWQQLDLHLARELHLVRGAALRLEPLGHARGEAEVVEGHGGLCRHGAEEPPVLSRVRLLREARAERHETQELAARRDGHQEVRRERRERRDDRAPVVPDELARPALARQVAEARGVARELGRLPHRPGRRAQPRRPAPGST